MYKHHKDEGSNPPLPLQGHPSQGVKQAARCLSLTFPSQFLCYQTENRKIKGEKKAGSQEWWIRLVVLAPSPSSKPGLGGEPQRKTKIEDKNIKTKETVLKALPDLWRPAIYLLQCFLTTAT